MGITWQDKLARLGMQWKTIVPPNGLFNVSVRVRRNPGRVSFGDGDTLGEALEEAACGQGIDWDSVERKMTEAAWVSMAHC